MKIPTRILGLLVATVAAPVIAGCAGEVADDNPNTNTTESNLQSQEPPKEEAPQPSSASAPAASNPPPESASPPAPEEPDQPEQPEDPCPPCGMG